MVSGFIHGLRGRSFNLGSIFTLTRLFAGNNIQGLNVIYIDPDGVSMLKLIFFCYNYFIFLYSPGIQFLYYYGMS